MLPSGGGFPTLEKNTKDVSGNTPVLKLHCHFDLNSLILVSYTQNVTFNSYVMFKVKELYVFI